MKIKHKKKTYEYNYKPVLMREDTHQRMKEIALETYQTNMEVMEKAIKEYHEKFVNSK